MSPSAWWICGPTGPLSELETGAESGALCGIPDVGSEAGLGTGVALVTNPAPGFLSA